MIRTLKVYIAKDLVKATVLATAVLTLVLTVIAIIEPLREKGISSNQALQIFGYSTLLMLSLTLPMAALFAATIVYGRFAQDNELMACSASGISTLTLMKPAFWLAAVVSIITLVLNMYVAPSVVYYLKRSAKQNIQQLVYHKLLSDGYFRWDNRSGLEETVRPFFVHADYIEMNGDQLDITGLVVLDCGEPGDVGCLTASSATVELPFRGPDQYYVVFRPENPTAFKQSGENLGMAERFPIEHGRAAELVADDPRFYDWSRLLETRAHPSDNRQVVNEMNRIRRQICLGQFFQDVTDTVNATGQYEKLAEIVPEEMAEMAKPISIQAHAANLDKRGELALLPAEPATQPVDERAPPDDRHSVVVRMYAYAPGTTSAPAAAGKKVLYREYRAASARLQGTWDDYRSCLVVKLTLNDVFVNDPRASVPGHHQAKCELWPYAVPEEIRRQAESVSLDDLYSGRGEQGWPANVGPMVNRLHQYTVAKLMAKVDAEIHQRLAYGVNCFLMVMLGTALGLLFRGGQTLAAVAITAVIVMVVACSMLMGRQLIEDSVSSSLRNQTLLNGRLWGVVMIWGGIVAMALANAWVYLVRLRR